jgi:hypothetical protein
MSFFFSFTKSEQVLPGEVGTSEGGRGGERPWEGEHSANTVYTCM